ncbi:hypothetical protein WP50_16610, partial [Lactiplantibacillus plantarum]
KLLPSTAHISVAYVYSIYAVVANDLLNAKPMVTDFFWELATLIVIMLLGHWIEMNTVMNAGSAVDKLAKLAVLAEKAKDAPEMVDCDCVPGTRC